MVNMRQMIVVFMVPEGSAFAELSVGPTSSTFNRGCMHFTITFESAEDRDYSYGLVFVPCPVWVQGTSQILNLTPENPKYTKGRVRRLLASQPQELSEAPAKRCVVIAHASGHGTAEDLNELIRDLEMDAFEVTLLRLPG